MIHLNARSLVANYEKMVDFLNSLSLKFDIISISDNSLNNFNQDLYDIHGYDSNHLIRPNCRNVVSLYMSQRN